MSILVFQDLPSNSFPSDEYLHNVSRPTRTQRVGTRAKVQIFPAYHALQRRKSLLSQGRHSAKLLFWLSTEKCDFFFLVAYQWLTTPFFRTPGPNLATEKKRRSRVALSEVARTPRLLPNVFHLVQLELKSHPLSPTSSTHAPLLSVLD